MKNNQVTAIILTKNEQQDLSRCLKSLQWCDSILVIDGYSKDKTVQIAKKYNARVIQRHLKNHFSQQRNFALKHVKTEWALFIDADEEVPAPLAQEIKQAIIKRYPLAYRLKRRDFFLKKPLKHGETSRWNQIRLSQTNAGTWIRPVHELWEIEGTVGQLKTPLLHYSHHDLNEFFNKINYYSTLSAQQHFQQKHRTNALQIIYYPIFKFILNYFIYLGFLDNTRGFVHATCMSFQSFLTRGKLYLLQRDHPN